MNAHYLDVIETTRYAKAKLIPAMSNGCTIVTYAGEIELTKVESALLSAAVDKILINRLKTGRDPQ